MAAKYITVEVGENCAEGKVCFHDVDDRHPLDKDVGQHRAFISNTEAKKRRRAKVAPTPRVHRALHLGYLNQVSSGGQKAKDEEPPDDGGDTDADTGDGDSGEG